MEVSSGQNIGRYMGLEPTASNTDWTNSQKTNLALLERNQRTLERGWKVVETSLQVSARKRKKERTKQDRRPWTLLRRQFWICKYV
jgi:hypothetical protein